MMNNDEIIFLDESNKIESVFDADSLKQALFSWNYLKSQKSLTKGVILKTHKILMLHQKLMPHHRGYFRDCDVQVGGRRCPSWQQLNHLMEEWIKRVKLTLEIEYNEKDAEELSKSLHINYEFIHPFVDGKKDKFYRPLWTK